jgi:hypothetical protein
LLCGSVPHVGRVAKRQSVAPELVSLALPVALEQQRDELRQIAARMGAVVRVVGRWHARCFTFHGQFTQ